MKYTDSGTWQTKENFYLMFAPPEKTHQGEIKQLLHTAFLRYRAHREGRTTWYFDVHEFLRVQEVTEAEKREALRLFDNVLNYYPAGVQSTHKEELRKLIETYETGEDRHKGESLIDILNEMFPDADKRNITKVMEALQGKELKGRFVFPSDMTEWRGDRESLRPFMVRIRESGIKLNRMKKIFAGGLFKLENGKTIIDEDINNLSYQRNKG